MPMKVAALDVEPLIENLRAAARLRAPEAIVARIKDELESFIPDGGLQLPERFRRTRPDSYCRRLLHRDAELGFTALLMTWGPGQRTALHDHAGIWCVEGVVEGELEVHRYELLEEDAAGRCRFIEKGSVHARPGSAGSLIPPFEHHVLANSRADRIALTLHVYGGEMDHCSIFLPEAADAAQPAPSAGPGNSGFPGNAGSPAKPGRYYQRQSRRLAYDE
jgi:predicted metal-dependent enzyme (double-stranded beta helix superfamily)